MAAVTELENRDKSQGALSFIISKLRGTNVKILLLEAWRNT